MATENTNGDQANGESDQLREAIKSAFDAFEKRARSFAALQAPSDEDRQRLHEAYIDYMALRAASRGRWTWRRGRKTKFRRFVAYRLATSVLLFAPIWIAAVLIILDRL